MPNVAGVPPPKKLRSLFSADDLVSPTLVPELLDAKGLGSLLTEVGLPRALGDWFRAVEVVQPRTLPCSYVAGELVWSLRLGAILGHSPFGSIVLDLDSGAVVYADDSDDTQLVNSSLAAFLFFAGEWLRAARKGFVDVPPIRNRLRAADGIVLTNPEGVWSVMLEEAEAGLY